MKQRIIILYDGVHNPVFQSQVVEPLIKHLDQHPDERAILISFERTKLSLAAQQQRILDPRIRLIILHKLPFFGSLSLRYAARQLKSILHQHGTDISTIICRGPLAAWIVGHIPLSQDISCIVQARGLAAQEYLYAHSSRRFSWFHRLRAYQYECIERWVYGTYAHHTNVIVHAVSKALKTYLIETFAAPPDKVAVADHDLPANISTAQRLAWHTATRNQLGIPMNAYVYIYNGSAKPWQCPEQTIQFFINAYQKNSGAFLLILTQDANTFITLLARHNLPTTSFYITHVTHSDIYRYLAAANAGIILREPHIINWVSRPTKALEYQAVGLPIIHNNTISMLAEKNPSFKG